MRITEIDFGENVNNLLLKNSINNENTIGRLITAAKAKARL